MHPPIFDILDPCGKLMKEANPERYSIRVRYRGETQFCLMLAVKNNLSHHCNSLEWHMKCNLLLHYFNDDL